MSTKLVLGESGQGRATIAIAANVGVKYDASNPGNVVVTTTGDRPIGVTQEATAAGQMCTFWKRARAYVAGAGIAAGDLVKCTTAGAFVSEASVAVLTAATVGQAMDASDSANNCDIQFF